MSCDALIKDVLCEVNIALFVGLSIIFFEEEIKIRYQHFYDLSLRERHLAFSTDILHLEDSLSNTLVSGFIL